MASTPRFEDEADLAVVMQEAKKYYANISMCYVKQVQTAWNIVKDLDVEMIAPSHGVSWRPYAKDSLSAYFAWSENAPESGAVVVYDSMWHSTEMLANVITQAFADCSVNVKLFDLKATHHSDIVPKVLTSKYIIVGSQTLNNQVLPTVAGFLCYLKGLSPKGRQAFAFGSYGWGGQATSIVQSELEACGFEICLEAQKVAYIPSLDQQQDVYQKVRQMIMNTN